MEGWGWDTGLAVWGIGCLVHIAGFHSWAVAAEKEQEVVSVRDLSLCLDCQDRPPLSSVPAVSHPQNPSPPGKGGGA